jgi:intracellular multiplication protein IcmX
MSYDATSWTKDCSFLFQTLVSSNVVGALPSSQDFFNYKYIQQFMPQLNSNALTGPLLYSTQSAQTNSTSSPQPTQGTNAGLTAQNQAQIAANFIRYVSGAVTPLRLPKWRDYDTLYSQAIATVNNNQDLIKQQQAQGTLSTYLASLRSFAAQNSVGLSNLYYIMSKRLPQQSQQSAQSGGGNSTPPMSQALSEFNMATWRIFNPTTANSTGGNKQWINQINTSSTATVQKEIAILLSEINYQLYLDRQIQERLLLTNSILLLQSSRANQPAADLTPK